MSPTTTTPVPEASSPPADRVRIVSTPGTCGGRPRIDGHRVTVEDVALWHERQGMCPDEIVSAYPSLTLAEVHAALAYYYENRDIVDSSIREGERMAAEMRAKAGPSLVRRKLQAGGVNAADHPLPPG